MTTPALLATHLCKSFGELRAVDDVSFEVAPGEIVGLVGPNGAGKTTTINMVLGVLAPSAGRHRDRGGRPRPRAQPRPGGHQLRRRLRAAARQPHRRAEPARLRHDLPGQGPVGADRGAARAVRPGALPHDQGRRAVVRRADPAGARQGDAEPAAPAAAGRAHRLDRPLDRPRHPRRHLDAGRRRRLRGAVDQPQHVRGRGGLRPGDVPVARQDPAGGRPEDAAGRARRGQPRRPLRRRRPRGPARRGGGAPARRRGGGGAPA